MEFFARKLPVPQHWADFYNRVNEIIPGADLDIGDISPWTIVHEGVAEACKDLGIAVRPQCACLAVDKPSIEFLLYKNVPLEKMLEIPDPNIFGELKLRSVGLQIYTDGYKLPSAGLWNKGFSTQLDLYYPDASGIRLHIISEEQRRKKESKSAFAPLASH